jgi:hypothetical protein
MSMLPISVTDAPRFTPAGAGDGVVFFFQVPTRRLKARMREAMVAANATASEATLRAALRDVVPQILVEGDTGDAIAALDQFWTAADAIEGHRMVDEDPPAELVAAWEGIEPTVREIERHALAVPSFAAMAAKVRADRDIISDIVVAFLLTGWEGVTHPKTQAPLLFRIGPDGRLPDVVLDLLPPAWVPELAGFALGLFGTSAEQKKSSASRST